MRVYRVSELDETLIGDKVLLDASIKLAEVKPASNGTNFLNIVLADNKNEISGKIWGVKDDTAEFVKSNKFLRFTVKVDEYRGKLQIVADKVAPIPEDELDISKLEKLAPESIEGLILELEGTINELEDPAIKQIVTRRYMRVKDKFVQWPAARNNHHNYVTGLLYHTVSMLRLAKNNLRQYPGKLDKDIVLGGIVLHDMDKIYEYSEPEKPEFTEMGKLLGHIFMSGAKTYAEAEKLKVEDPNISLAKVKYLIHVILAHHGKLEWGSPVVPQTIEAEIVHQIDMMDSRMNMNYDK